MKVVEALMTQLHLWSKLGRTIQHGSDDWTGYLEAFRQFDPTAQTWLSVHLALNHDPVHNRIKPSQLNITHGTEQHMFRLVFAGLAYCDVSEEPIEAHHMLRKSFMCLSQLFLAVGNADAQHAAEQTDVTGDIARQPTETNQHCHPRVGNDIKHS